MPPAHTDAKLASPQPQADLIIARPEDVHAPICFKNNRYFNGLKRGDFNRLTDPNEMGPSLGVDAGG
jgi:hypothetical protein